jgi:hypothetical protein
MSIIHDLYRIYDQEFTRYREKRSSQNGLQRELRHNLAFLREGLREKLPAQELIRGLDDVQFKKAVAKGIDINRLQSDRLDKRSFGGIREFFRYEGWATERLIETAYERIAVLKKLAERDNNIDFTARLRNLFKLLLLIQAHIDEQPIPVRPAE